MFFFFYVGISSVLPVTATEKRGNELYSDTSFNIFLLKLREFSQHADTEWQ